MVRTAPPFVRTLGAEHRLLLLGGLAVIYHGHSRLTKDVDIWLDPGVSADAWAATLRAAIGGVPSAYFWDLSRRARVSGDDLAEVVEAVGVIRIGGLECDLDVFRVPNNLEPADFEAAWQASIPFAEEPFRITDEPLLIATKLDTDRPRDREDISFLESRIRERLFPILAACSPEEARAHFARYADHVTCEAALRNPHPEVHALAIETLREFAAAQNPFARELLRGLGETPP